MNPIPCSTVTCIRLWAMHEDRPCECIGSRCSQWIPRTGGSPPVANVGICADNGERMMVDGGGK